MPKVRRFEELISWQKARQLANVIYDFTARTTFARDFKLRNQIQGASGSVMHDIAEGSDSGTDVEFIRFLKMARRSASEVQSELYLALDRKYILPADLKTAYELADETKRLINGLIVYLRKYQKGTSNHVSEVRADYDVEVSTNLPDEYYLPQSKKPVDKTINYYEPNDYQTDDYETGDLKTGD